MERGRFEVVLEAENRARGALRQFGSQIRETMRRARQDVERAGRAMRQAGEDVSALGRGGQMASRGLQALGGLAIRPLLGMLSLLASGVMAVVGAFGRLLSAAVNLAREIVSGVIAAARRAIDVLQRLALVSSVALAGAFVVAANKAASFEQNMRDVNVIMRASEEQWRGYRDQVLALSTEVPQTADVLARGLYNIASAGFAGEQGIEVLTVAAHAAVAGLAETDEAAKAITATLNAYGWSAEQAQRVSDVLFKTVEKGVVTFPELAEYIGMVVTSASQASVPFEEVAAAMATMTKGGLNAAVSATALNRIILTFLDAPDELAEAIAGVSDESAEWIIQNRGLTGAMEVLNRIAGENPAVLASIGLEMRALRAAMSLARGEGRAFTADVEQMYQATGATQAAYAEQSKALSVQWDLMKSSIAALAITLGNMFLPVIEKAVQAVGRIATRVKEWIDAHPELQQRIEALGAAIESMILSAESRIGEWLDWLSENWRDVWDAVVEKTRAAADWIAMWIGRIVAAVQYLWDNRGKVWEWANNFMAAVREVGRAIAREIAQRVLNLMEGLGRTIKLPLGIEVDVGALKAAAAGGIGGAVAGGVVGGPWGALAGGYLASAGGAKAFIGAKDWLRDYMERGGETPGQLFARYRAGIAAGEGGLGGMYQAAAGGGQQYASALRNFLDRFGGHPGFAEATAGGRMMPIAPGVWEIPATQPEIGRVLAEQRAAAAYAAQAQPTWGRQPALAAAAPAGGANIVLQPSLNIGTVNSKADFLKLVEDYYSDLWDRELDQHLSDESMYGGYGEG